MHRTKSSQGLSKKIAAAKKLVEERANSATSPSKVRKSNSMGEVPVIPTCTTTFVIDNIFLRYL